MSSPTFVYTFPSVRGVQAGREFFISQCPVRLLSKIFAFTDAELPVEMRAQRTLNAKRIPEIAQYVVANRLDYTFSAITASIDAEVSFEPVADSGSLLGSLHVPMDARFIINDGQHRHAALTAALESDPTLGDETIAVVFFIDVGLARSQQMFADLNRHSVKPSASIGVLYDHREPMADLTRRVVKSTKLLRDMVEPERSTLSPKSRKLFTLSAVHQAHVALLAGLPDEQREQTAKEFWSAAFGAFPEWQLVHEGQISAGDVRQDYISSHGTVLHALGRVANGMLRSNSPGTWEDFASAVKALDWSRRNAQLWEGRALVAGHVSKSNQSVALTAAVVKRELGIPLSADEIRFEQAIGGSSK